MPKFNLYQSLHTTVVGPHGQGGRGADPHAGDAPARRVRHRRALGLQGARAGRRPAVAAAHGRLAAGDLRPRRVHGVAEDRPRVRRGLRLHAQGQGDHARRPAPRRSTSRYAIHTDVGHRCIGARVNGRLVPLDSALASGDTVEIFTSKVEGAGPSRDWLQFVHTPKARTKIRQWFSRERRVDAIDTGREELAKALRKEGLPVQKLARLRRRSTTSRTRCTTPTSRRCYAAIGEDHVSAKAVVQRLQKELRGGEEQLPVTTARPPRARPRRRSAAPPACTSRASTTSWCGCRAAARRCRATRSWASSPAAAASRSTAPTAPTPPASSATPSGSSRSSGTTTSPATFVVSVEVEALDRSRLLRDVAHVLAEHHVNILSCTSQTSSRPRREVPLRLRARRPEPPRLDPLGDQARRLRLRGVPGAPGPRQGPRELARHAWPRESCHRRKSERVTELLERVVADPRSCSPWPSRTASGS